MTAERQQAPEGGGFGALAQQLAKDPQDKFKPGHLRLFSPFDEMGAEQIIVAGSRIKFAKFEPEDLLLSIGSADADDYYLLAGTVELRQLDGGGKLINAGSSEARQAIAQVRPSLYKVVAATQVTVFTIPAIVVAVLREEGPQRATQIDDDMSLDVTHTRQFLHDFHKELQSNRVALLSMTDLIVQLRDKIDRTSDFKELAAIVQHDPALTIKLVKQANSPLFRGPKEIRDCPHALVRLGPGIIRELVFCFTVKDVFKTDSDQVKRRIVRGWRTSINVAALCTVFARYAPELDTQRAALAGLLHNVGVLPIFSYVSHSPVHLLKPHLIDRAVERMQARAGAMILRAWKLGEDLAEVAEASGEWLRDSGPQLDYADIANLGLYHHLLAEKSRRKLPSVDELPAARKISDGGLTPELSMSVIQEARAAATPALQLLS